MYHHLRRPGNGAWRPNMIRTFALGLAIAALTGSAVAAGTGHCTGGETKVVSLCGSESLEGGAAWLQYRFGEPGDIELQYPETRAGSTSAFTFRVYTRARVSLSKLEFSKGGYTYAILDDFVDELDGPQDRLSLRVTRDSSGETVASFDLVRKTETDGILHFMSTLPTEPYDE